MLDSDKKPRRKKTAETAAAPKRTRTKKTAQPAGLDETAALLDTPSIAVAVMEQPQPEKRVERRNAATAAEIHNWMTPEERRQLIALKAWLRAEARGFQSGSPDQDWLEAEMEVDALLMRLQSSMND